MRRPRTVTRRQCNGLVTASTRALSTLRFASPPPYRRAVLAESEQQHEVLQGPVHGGAPPAILGRSGAACHFRKRCHIRMSKGPSTAVRRCHRTVSQPRSGAATCVPRTPFLIWQAEPTTQGALPNMAGGPSDDRRDAAGSGRRESWDGFPSGRLGEQTV